MSNYFDRLDDDDVAAQERADGIKPRLRFSQIPQYPRTQPKPVAVTEPCERCNNTGVVPTDPFGGVDPCPKCAPDSAFPVEPEAPVNCENCGRRIRISDYPAFNWADRILADSDYEEARAAKRCRYCPKTEATK